MLRRNRSGLLLLYPQLDLYLSQSDIYLMSSKKQAGHLSSHYHVAMDERDFEEGSPKFMGKVVSNFMGTHFEVQSRGKVIASIHFEASSGGMEVYIPDPKNPPTDSRPLKELYADTKQAIRLRKREGIWDKAKKVEALDFKGRVNKVSVKNIILEDADKPTHDVLLFGRLDDGFSLDVAYPLSLLQAFGVAMFKMDFKIMAQ